MLAVNDEIEIVKGDVKLSWINIGEGICGDYDKSDPEDINLLRFDVYVKEEDEVVYEGDVRGNWVPVENGSLCTQVPAATSKEELTRLLNLLMNRFYPVLHNNHEVSIKRLAERMTWIKDHITEDEMNILCCI